MFHVQYWELSKISCWCPKLSTIHLNFELISLYWAQYLNTFWFLIDKFLSLLGRAWVPKVPIATTPMISGIGILLLLDTSFNISNGSKILYYDVQMFVFVHHSFGGIRLQNNKDRNMCVISSSDLFCWEKGPAIISPNANIQHSWDR